MAPYQKFKMYLVETVGLSKTGFHFVLGFIVYISFAKLFGIKLSSAKSLIAPIIFAFLLELMDYRDAASYGFWFDWMDSVKDIAVTTSLPLFTFLMFALFAKKNNDQQH